MNARCSCLCRRIAGLASITFSDEAKAISSRLVQNESVVCSIHFQSDISTPDFETATMDSREYFADECLSLALGSGHPLTICNTRPFATAPRGTT